jgi:hypothetical protein
MYHGLLMPDAKCFITNTLLVVKMVLPCRLSLAGRRCPKICVYSLISLGTFFYLEVVIYVSII